MDFIEIYVLQWTIDINDDEIIFHAWGRDLNNNRVCVHVTGFLPFLYIEPAQFVKERLEQFLKDPKQLPVKIENVDLPKIYYANLNSDLSRKISSMARCSFTTNNDFRYINNMMSRKYINSKKYQVHEYNIPPLLQFICTNNLSMVGWHKFCGTKRKKYLNDTYLDLEFDCLSNDCEKIDKIKIPNLNVISFDIEVYSSVHNRMPKANVPDDKIIQISLVNNDYEYLLHLGEVDDKCKNLNPAKQIFVKYNTETDLLIGFVQLIHKLLPDILIGYNILGFDFNYIIERSKLLRCFGEIQKMGLNKVKLAEICSVKWTSSAFRNQEFIFPSLDGIVIFDLLPLVRRDFKFSSYKLDSVASILLSGQTKDKVSPMQIFKYWASQDPILIGKIAQYCIKDSLLVYKLFNKLQTLNANIEMADICKVQMFDLYTRGQQLKVFSQIYYHCFKKIVLDNLNFDSVGYSGARVFEPNPGIYENVVSFDFTSLYPSIIIAGNICFSTCVPDSSLIPDELCNVYEWEDHVGCEHDSKIIMKDNFNKKISKQKKEVDFKTLSNREKVLYKINKANCSTIIDEKSYHVEKERKELVKYKPKYIICEKRKFRFLKDIEGVMPIIIKNLLTARKIAKGEMKKYSSDSIEYIALNARQLALKVSANSMYGFFGATKGYLPFPPAAMTVTYLGRQIVFKAAKIITQKYKGKLIYGDTDSVYANFPEIRNDVSQLWNWAKYVAAEVSKQFPKPLNLEFEDKIYKKFLILTKKKYIYQACELDGKLKDELEKKGVLIVRRDYCIFVKQVYESIIKLIFEEASFEDCLIWLIQNIIKLISKTINSNDLTITKAVGDSNDCEVTGKTETGKQKVGDYSIPNLPSDDEKKKKALKLKGALDEKDFIKLSLPPQIQLAIKMRNRGMIIENGSRIEYLVTNVHNTNGRMGLKIEDLQFYNANKWFLTLDYLYYIKSMITPLDQLFDIVFSEINIMTNIHKYCIAKFDCMQELKKKFSPIIEIID